MPEELFDKWKTITKEKAFDKRMLNDLYEEEGRKILDSYNDKADSIQGWANTFQTTRDILREEIKASRPIDEIRILDLGCGADPRMFLSLNRDFSICKLRYVGDEISLSKLKTLNMIARSVGVKTILSSVCLDCHDIPFKDCLFDFVICNDTIEHLLEPEKALCEIGRVLKDDGLAVISTPNRDRPDVLIRKMIDFLKFKERIKNQYFMAVSHLNEFTHREFEGLLKKAGMYIKKTYILNYPFSLGYIKRSGYFSKLPDWLLIFPYKLLNFMIRNCGVRKFSTHIFLTCGKVIR
jgi:SAM-dependent methyltransferase